MAIEGQNPNPGEPNPNPAPGGQPGGPTPQPSPNPAPTPAPGDPKPGQPDRREAGVLADLQKERKARQALEQQLATHKAELESERRRVQALAGVNPKSEGEVEDEQIRQHFAQVFPSLAKLNSEKLLERLEKLLAAADTNEDTTKRYWNDRATQMTQGVVEAISEELGGDLSERQVKNIRAAYATRAQNDPDFLARHEEADPKLIEEFAKEWIEDWFVPARRKVITNEVARNRPVPGSRDRSIAGPKPKAIDFKDQKAVEDAMVESFRGHGGTFSS